jgi:hypothetical protein
MAVDMRARYFGEFDEGAMPSFSAFPQGMPQPSAFEAMPMSGAAQPMMPSFSAFPQATPQPSPFEVMPMSGAAPTMDTPREAAVMPMTQEAAPFDLSSLAGLDLSGLGGFGGGRMGGVIQDPNIQYITAPVSNKGNPTGRMGGNVFAVTPDQPVRLVDLRTNTIVFEGTGVDAARKATEVGQSLTDSLGRKANYDIQTADPSGAYTTVANEKANKSTLGTLGQIVGTALPIVVSLVPGLQFAGPVLSAAIAGGAGAAMAGRDPVKGAIMGGLSAAGGQVLGPALQGAGVGAKAAAALGTGLGSTAGGLATGQSLKSSLLGGVASGALSYVAPNIQDELGISTKSGSLFRGSTPSVGADGYTGLTVTGGGTTSSPNLTLGGSPNKIQQALRQGTEAPFDGITAIGSRLANVNLGGTQFGAPGQDQSAFEKMYNDPFDPNEILVKARPATQTSSFSVNTGGNEITPEYLPKEDIVVDATRRITPGPGFTLSSDTVTDTNQKSDDEKAREEEERKRKLSLADALALLNLVGGIGGGGGGGGGGGTPGSQALNPIFSAKLPTPGVGGAFKVGGLDYTTPPATDAYRYAMGPAMDIPAGMNLSKATSPYAGYGPGTLGEETFKRVAGMAPTRTIIGQGSRLVDGRRVPYNIYDDGTSDPFVIPDRLRTAAPITTPVPNNPAGPAMYVPDDMRFAEGGAFAAKGYARGSSRDSFAVDGPGTGRSDDIPAVLSDGEYVIDAETVALLGDGSSKAGAKKLDEMRVKVRKHKGRNLAKGKFSVNAKRPEKYLSGGRT